MNEDQWYYYQDGQPTGPVTFAQLQQLVTAGSVAPDTFVSRPGMSEWVAASTLPELQFPARLPPQPPVPAAPVASGPSLLERARKLTAGGEDISALTPHLRLVQKFLGWLKGVLSTRLLDGFDRTLMGFGHLAYMFASLVFVLFYAIAGIKIDSSQIFLGSVLVVLPMAVILHFTAGAFLHSGVQLIRKSPSELASRSFLDCYGLLTLTAALVAVIYGFVQLFQRGSDGLSSLAINLGAAVLLTYLAGAALNPDSLNIEIGGRAGAGAEAIGIIAFLAKLGLRLVPTLFGVGALLGAIASLFVFSGLFEDDPYLMLRPVFAGKSTLEVTGWSLLVGLLPFAAYLLFLFEYLLLDLWRAVLVVPSKLDALREAVRGEPAADED